MTVRDQNEKDQNGLFYVNALGVIFDTKSRKILIGRRENDPHVKNLTWSFPGGRVHGDEDIEVEVENVILKKTGLQVKSLGCISSGFARIPSENKKSILLYYLCEVVGGGEETSDAFKELKWVNPEELEDYFTTSFDPRIKEYVLNLR